MEGCGVLATAAVGHGGVGCASERLLWGMDGVVC